MTIEHVGVVVQARWAMVREPERFIGMHFFNPVPVMALLELIRGRNPPVFLITRITSS